MDNKLHIYFKDEVPRIGSGWRYIVVDKLGWKWVTIRDPHSHRKARIRRSLWDRLNVPTGK
jgi:hypothetical protein